MVVRCRHKTEHQGRRPVGDPKCILQRNRTGLTSKGEWHGEWSTFFHVIKQCYNMAQPYTSHLFGRIE